MTQWTPQTRDGKQKCIAPYYFADTRIRGFRGSHFMSGSCTQDFGSVTLMPMTGSLKLGACEPSSAFRDSEDQTSPYRYAVDLRDYRIHVEITGTARAGFLRFRMQHAGKVWIAIENNGRSPDAYRDRSRSWRGLRR